MEPDPPIISRRLAVRLYAVATGAAILGLIVDVTGVFGWSVDTTAVGLIAILLLIPLAEHMRKLKVGSVEAEFAEKVGYLDRRVTEFTDLATKPADEPEAQAGALAQADSAGATIRAIDRIVWVDDRPEGNRLELAELRRYFDVITANSTGEGLDQVAKSPEDTAVITDAVRVEGGEENFNAGLDLIEALQARSLAIPVYVFCGFDTAEKYAEPLVHAGAWLVTGSFTELARRIRADARLTFEAEVATTLQAVGEVEPRRDGADFVVSLGEARVGVEVKDYRGGHELHDVSRAMKRLGEEIEAGGVDKGVIVAPRDVFTSAQRQRAPEGVLLTSVSQLPQVLGVLPGA
jgi:hypothetical protein